ncbi:HPr family phosphocarrier protein [Orrella daihaiensis]|uniref:HPr family phosphocarrier protein n=1 Tax=Orrella daihaiensis TaxID=2782176 RepID=A0ABY4AGJ3_9BURK|nr:HPr family phosphocarrier protein [Orrella daihaiensis]UOD49410.1 HPr family phosphocarrier protein [Orrella daihaiensis]
MPQIDLVVSNKLGLHARAAAKLTKLAGQFASDVFIAKDARRVNAKSIMGVMMLAAGKGTTVQIEAEGGDAQQALDAIKGLFDDKFGEGE